MIAVDMREQGGRSSCRWTDGWVCRSGFSIPAPIACAGGSGGSRPPRHRHADPLPEHRVPIYRLPHTARRGPCPRTPAHDWAGKATE